MRRSSALTSRAPSATKRYTPLPGHELKSPISMACALGPSLSPATTVIRARMVRACATCSRTKPHNMFLIFHWAWREPGPNYDGLWMFHFTAKSSRVPSDCARTCMRLRPGTARWVDGHDPLQRVLDYTSCPPCVGLLIHMPSCHIACKPGNPTLMSPRFGLKSRCVLPTSNPGSPVS